MAKQVIWSLVAKKQLKEAFQILKLKNGNNEVGEVLYVQLQNILHRISMNPFIGQTTEVENIRYIIPHPGYTLFYRHFAGISMLSSIIPSTVSRNFAGCAVSRKTPVSPGFNPSFRARKPQAPCGSSR